MSITRCRVLIDPPAGGAWNMAIDEALFRVELEADECCLRFYRWSSPTLSLGYFQRLTDRRLHAASRECPVVRRTSGGGAIVHDAELTYSLIVPDSHPLAPRRSALYEAVAATLVDALEDVGASGARVLHASDSPSERVAPREQPFLCFQRQAAGDVVLAGTKIAGSAQRRRRQAVMQHGSVLLATSAAAPELPGLEQLAGTAIAAERLIAAWQPRLAAALHLEPYPSALSAEQVVLARQIAEERFASTDWTDRR